jgi:hypothetical protein
VSAMANTKRIIFFIKIILNEDCKLIIVDFRF